ncbi:MAG: stage III sporulation protein AE [Clostridia bacterium]|nr:stage III sporulation protein AE [Clostridia bacterium]
MKKKRRFFAASLSIMLFLTLFCVGTAAEKNEGTMPDGYLDFIASVPEDVAELLPEGFFSDDLDDVGQAVEQMSTPGKILEFLLNLLSGGMGSALSLFAALTSLTALSALIKSAGEGIISGDLSDTVSFAASLAVTVTAAGLQYGRISALSVFFSSLRTVMASLLPLMGFLYLSGGNAAAAAVNNSSVILWIDLLDILVSSWLMPAFCICTALAVSESFCSGEMPGLSAVSSLIKRSAVFVLGLCGTLLAAALGTQSVLAAAGDGVSARTVKFFAGNMIPVVGSTVGDTLRTVAASTKLLRSTVGVAGIVVIAILLLPTLVSLLLTRLAFSSSAAVGELLGCKKEVKFLNEMASLYGYVIAAAAICSVLFVFALTVFSVTSSAVGGAI